MILIIWFICRRGLTSRDDPLDPYALSQKQLGDDLLVGRAGRPAKRLVMGGPPANVLIFVLVRGGAVDAKLKIPL